MTLLLSPRELIAPKSHLCIYFQVLLGMPVPCPCQVSRLKTKIVSSETNTFMNASGVKDGLLWSRATWIRITVVAAELFSHAQKLHYTVHRV